MTSTHSTCPCFVCFCLRTCPINLLSRLVQFRRRVWGICFHQTLINLVSDYVLRGEMLSEIFTLTEWPFTAWWWLTIYTNSRPPGSAQTRVSTLWSFVLQQNVKSHVGWPCEKHFCIVELHALQIRKSEHETAVLVSIVGHCTITVHLQMAVTPSTVSGLIIFWLWSKIACRKKKNLRNVSKIRLNDASTLKLMSSPNFSVSSENKTSWRRTTELAEEKPQSSLIKKKKKKTLDNELVTKVSQ